MAGKVVNSNFEARFGFLFQGEADYFLSAMW